MDNEKKEFSMGNSFWRRSTRETNEKKRFPLDARKETENWWKRKANPQIIAEHIAAGADVNATGTLKLAPLEMAVLFNEDPDVCKVLLANGAIVNTEHEYGWTTIRCASMNPNRRVLAVIVMKVYGH